MISLLCINTATKVYLDLVLGDVMTYFLFPGKKKVQRNDAGTVKGLKRVVHP